MAELTIAMASAPRANAVAKSQQLSLNARGCIEV